MKIIIKNLEIEISPEEFKYLQNGNRIEKIEKEIKKENKETEKEIEKIEKENKGDRRKSKK